jgi:hypothetical protein
VPVKIAEPATDAGRRLLASLEPDVGGDWRRQIASVESQARTRGAELATEALRRNQKTEIVWFLEHNKNAADVDIIDGVLAILGIER